jgi:hypothetical protein
MDCGNEKPGRGIKKLFLADSKKGNYEYFRNKSECKGVDF